MENVQVVVSLGSLLFLMSGAGLTWAWNMQKQISTLKTEVAVNTAKDTQIENHVLKMEDKIDELIKSVNEVKQHIAEIRATKK